MERNGNITPPESPPAAAPPAANDTHPGSPQAEPAPSLPALSPAGGGAAVPADSFDPVLLRPRHDGWTPERQRAFIEHLADTLCVETAAARVGMSAQSAYALRRRAGAEGFAAAWDAALRRGICEQARSRFVDKAVNGKLVRRFYHGKLIAEERVYSERLLLALIEKGEKLFAGPGAAQSEAIAEDWDGAMARLERGAFDGGYRVWRDRYGNWATNYPPPPGFDNYLGEPEDPEFERGLTEAEEEALAAQQAARIAAGEAARDAFFGFAPRGRAIDRRSRLKR
jgi:hypothetical protein